jgi:hypothetical protein
MMTISLVCFVEVLTRSQHDAIDCPLAHSPTQLWPMCHLTDNMTVTQ